jgi:DNA-binding transcriptional regulator YdaS (Cro superfamily)
MAKSDRDPFLIALFNACGGPSKLAGLLGVTPSAPMQWDKLPKHRVYEVEALTGIPKEMLRPDLHNKKRKVGADEHSAA